MLRKIFLIVLLSNSLLLASTIKEVAPLEKKAEAVIKQEPIQEITASPVAEAENVIQADTSTETSTDSKSEAAVTTGQTATPMTTEETNAVTTTTTENTPVTTENITTTENTATVSNDNATQETTTQAAEILGNDNGEGVTEVVETYYDEPNVLTEKYIKDLYKDLKIAKKIDYSLFKRSFMGYYKTPSKIPGILTIIDYTKPSNEPRFYVLDLRTRELKYETYVSHGKNSGLIVPVNFSNTRNSYQTSLGFYLTGNVYDGDFGHSLKLFGLEDEFNSNVYERKIVIHGASYADPSFIKTNGFLGRTNGCPALPPSVAEEIIEFLKDGTVIFVNGNDSKYLQRSHYASL